MESQTAERKTLDDRNKMTELERIRHSCAHVLATAILRLWPEAQFAAGPPVETGFYYDVDLPHRISPEDFPAIEAEMKKEVKANHVFEKKVVTRDQAFKDAQADIEAAKKAGNYSEVKQLPLGDEKTSFGTLCARYHLIRARGSDKGLKMFSEVHVFGARNHIIKIRVSGDREKEEALRKTLGKMLPEICAAVRKPEPPKSKEPR